MSSPVYSHLSAGQRVLDADIPKEQILLLKEQGKLSLWDRFVLLFTGGGNRPLACFTNYKIELLQHPHDHQEELEAILGHAPDYNETSLLRNTEVSKNAIKSSKAFENFLETFYGPDRLTAPGQKTPPPPKPEYLGIHRTDIWGRPKPPKDTENK